MKYKYKRIPSRVVVAAFVGAKTAKIAAEDWAVSLSIDLDEEEDEDNATKTNKNHEEMACTSLAVISKNKAGNNLSVKEHGKNGPLSGFVEGGMVGGAIGGATAGLAVSLLGPIAIAAAGTAGGLVGATVGAAAGTVAGTIQGLTIQSSLGGRKHLKAFGDQCLVADSSMLIACFGEKIVPNAGVYNRYYSGTETIRAMATMSIRSALQDQTIFLLAFSVHEEGGIYRSPRTKLTYEANRIKIVEHLLDMVHDSDHHNDYEGEEGSGQSMKHTDTKKAEGGAGGGRPVYTSCTKVLLMSGLAKGRPTAAAATPPKETTKVEG